MKLIIIFATILAIANCLDLNNVDTGSTQDMAQNNYIRDLITKIVEHFAWKIQALGEWLDFKFRLVNFLISLWTPENLALLKQGLNYASRTSAFISSFIPSSEDGARYNSPYDGVVSFILRNTGLYPTTEHPGPIGDIPEIEDLQQDVLDVEESAPVATQVPVGDTKRPDEADQDVEKLTARILKNHRQQKDLEKLINSK